MFWAIRTSSTNDEGKDCSGHLPILATLNFVALVLAFPPPPPHPHPFLFPESLIIRTFHFYRLSKVLQIHKVCFLTTALQSRFILLLPCCCLGVRAAETGLPTYSPCELGIRLKFWTGICWIVAWLWAFMFHQRLCEMLATRTYFPPPFSHPGKTHPHTIPKAK